MKKHLTYFLLILLFNACQQHSYKTFVVKGNIKNANHKQVALISFNTHLQTIILDTATIDTKGNFNLKTLYNQQELYAIKVDTIKEFWLVNDVDEIEVNLDIKNYKLYQTKNSKASDNIKKFASYLDSLHTKIQSQTHAIDTLKLEKNRDSLIEVHKQKLKQYEKSLEIYCAGIVKTTQNPAEQFFYIYYTHKTNAAKQVDIKTWLEAAIKQNPQHSQLQGLNNYFNEYIASNPKEFLISQKAIDFSYYNIDSNKISLKTFAGKTLLINFWSAKNTDCIKWNDKLVQLYRKYSFNNFEILGISLDSNEAYWKKMVRKDSLNWQNVRDTLYYKSKLAEKYFVNDLPYNVLIDANGKIMAIGIKEDELKDKLREIVK